MDQLERLMPYRYAALGLYDEPADRLTFVVSRGFSPEELIDAERSALERHPGWVIRHKSPLLVDDTQSDPRARYLGSRRSRSVLMVPILYQDRCLGLLGLGNLEPAAYTLADQELLLAFANQVAVAVENARLYEREQVRRRQAHTLQEVGRLLNSTLAVDQVLDRILEQLERVTDYEGATVTLLRGDQLEVVACRGFADPAPIMALGLEIGNNTIFQKMVDTGAPVVMGDVRQDSRWMGGDGVAFTRAWIGAPLQVKGQIIGQLAVYHPQPGYYGDRDGQTLLTFAQQAAVAIENARLHEETRHWADRLEAMYEVSTAAATATSLDETLQHTVVALQQATGADDVALLLQEPDTGDLVIRAWVGFPEGPKLMRRQAGVGIPGWVVQTGKPALIPDVGQDSRYHACDEGACSELCVPLQVGQDVIGALNLESRQAAAFAQSDLQLLTVLAGNLASIIKNSRLFQGVQQSKRNWEATFDAMPDLIALLDDRYRIVQANKAMADRVGVPPGELEGRICYECVHEAQEPLPSCPYVRLLADGQRHATETHDGHLGGDFHVSVSPIHDAGGQLVGAVRVARDITERKLAEAERERLIFELQDALAKVKTLSGLLPICANCKKIRDDQGYWHGVEAYVRDHSEAEFSHSICPDCSSKLYPWFDRGEE